ncbi:MAG TPA: DUF6519 domain-containing protein [Candidatus Angelobacter sp.]
MSFDNSRFTFNPFNDYCGVVMEQGRVQLDSDWNEWLAELFRRIQAGTLDILGRAAYPATTPYAFEITASGTKTISIGPGRMYVDGLLAENHGDPASAQWDPALAELSGSPQPPPTTETGAIDYTKQPYFPNPPAISGNGPFLAYLDVWIRAVTYLEDPNFVDKAVGVDTTGRLQTVWQVKWMSVPSGTACGAPISGFPPDPSAGLLSTGTAIVGPSGPCCLTANTGYTGIENQFYRVEIHQPGSAATTNKYPADPGTATFKWSRDNASVATLVTVIATGTNSLGNKASKLTVVSMGRDQVLGFAPGNWIEIIDDNLELNGQPGELHQIDSIDFSGKTIILDSLLKATFPNDPTTTHTRIQRWDQSGVVYQDDNKTVWVDLGAAGSTGDIPVPPPGTKLILENGITVSFDRNPSTGTFNVGDFWTFAARTADGSVETLVKAPPRGIYHHYAPLSIVTFSPPAATDCRTPWEQGGCDCASCVTAQSHNSGSWTIQDAINAVQAQGGGKVCLGPGVYNISATINIAGAQNLAICGHGLPLLQPVAPFTGAGIMLIDACIDIDVEGIAFAGGAGAPGGKSLAGLAIQKSSFVRVEKCSFGLVTDALPLSPAISFADTVVFVCTIRDNLFNNVGVGVGLSGDAIFLTQLDIEDNQMFCLDGAVVLSSSTLFVSDIRFARNFVQSTNGFVLSGIGLEVSVEDNTFQIAASRESLSAAIVCNISQTRILNNDISPWSLLTATASGNQGLAAGTYFWIVTAVDASSGRERLITGLASLTLANPANVQLQWTAIGGVKNYNVYRTKVNTGALLLDGSVPSGSGTTVSYTDTVPDANLTTTLSISPNDGIVLRSTSGAIMVGTQIIGNQISGLMGAGISAGVEVILAETTIAENQVGNLGGSGIVVGGFAIDIDIARNSLVFVDLLPLREQTFIGGSIRLTLVINANLSENKIESVGSAIAGIRGFGAILIGVASEVRIAGNRIVDIAPGILSGIFGLLVLGRLDATDNLVRRASIVPAQPDQAQWLALFALGQTVNIQGNLLESFGSNSPGAVQINSQQCIFSNNQCFLDDPSGANTPILVINLIATQSIIAMGNRVQGPTASTSPAPSPSMALSVPAVGNIPPVTVIGNVTSAGISVNNGPVPTPMAPLNVIA